MANLFDGLYRIALIVLIVILILVVVGGAIYFYYMRVRSKRRKTLDNVDYSAFDRKDTSDYIKIIDDIRDDMIITEGMTRFIGVIDCQGYDFYSAHLVEQGNTVRNYLGFINTIDKPMSYRQHSKSVDLEYTINKYLDAYDDVCEKLDRTTNKLSEIQSALKKEMAHERKSIYLAEEKTTKRDVEAFTFRKFHLEDQLRYINDNSGSVTTPLVSSNYVFEWVYNPMEFSVDLSESEIIIRAKNELNAQANSKINSLANSGVKAKRCSTVELIDMCRRHSQPITSERYRIRDVLNSSYFDDITTSSSVQEINEDVRAKLSADASAKMNDEFLKMIDDVKNEPEENIIDEVMLSAGRVEEVS